MMHRAGLAVAPRPAGAACSRLPDPGAVARAAPLFFPFSGPRPGHDPSSPDPSTKERPMIRSALLLALAPAAAFAHAGPEGHLHPHGIEIALLGGAAVVALLVWRRARR